MEKQETGNTAAYTGGNEAGRRSSCCESYGRRESPVRSLFWALAFIFLGSLLFAQSQGWLGGDKWFAYFLIGLGAIFLLDVLVHYLSPAYHYFSFGRTMAGVILAAIGCSLLVAFTHWISLALVLIGVAIAGGYIIRKVNGSGSC